MRQQLIDLLKTLESAVPPPPNCHHAITFARYGSDEAGWVDKLALQVNYCGEFYCYFLDEGDFAEPCILCAIIKRDLAKAEVVAKMQRGVAMGQYTIR
jgi:hypothetical protein